MTMQNTHLKKCPFCNGAPELVEYDMPAGGPCFYYSCSDEHCQGCATPLDKCARRSDAAKAWNTRAEDPLAAENVRLREALEKKGCYACDPKKYYAVVGDPSQCVSSPTAPAANKEGGIMIDKLIDEVMQAMFDANPSGGNGYTLQSYSLDYRQHLRNQANAAIIICRQRKIEL